MRPRGSNTLSPNLPPAIDMPGFALAKEAGIDLMRGQNKQVVVAALAAEDEQIILDFSHRHGVEPKQPPATDADAITDTPTKRGEEGDLQ